MVKVQGVVPHHGPPAGVGGLSEVGRGGGVVHPVGRVGGLQVGREGGQLVHPVWLQVHLQLRPVSERVGGVEAGGVGVLG